MYPHLKNYLASVEAEGPVLNCNPYFSSWHLQMARAEQFSINDRLFLVQSINHYIADIELYEYTLDTDIEINYSLNESSFFMHVILKGNSILYDCEGQIVHINSDNSCHLSYSARGQYRKKIFAGEHKAILMTFRPEWLIVKCERLPEMSRFLMHYLRSPDQNQQLPACGISNRIFKSLKKLDFKTNYLNLDRDLCIFLNTCFNNYYRNIVATDTTKAYRRQQAALLAEFIQQNYASEIVEDPPKLAARFMVSERNLARLAKMAFNIPLHEQVIKIRMHAGLALLMETNKPVHEVARAIGYREPHYFSKAFKKYFGTSPKSVYKKSKHTATYETQG